MNPIKEPENVFDGAIGSGQMLQYIDAINIYGCDINEDALNYARQNYDNINVVCGSFFNSMGSHENKNKYDLCVSNYPFSLKVKDLSEEEQNNILADETLKKFYPKGKLTGVCDFLFIIKMFEMSKRYSLFLAFPSIAYRSAEKKFREYLTPYVSKIGTLNNCKFDHTSISILFVLLDKEHKGDAISFIKDMATGEKLQEKIVLDAEKWHTPHFETPVEDIDIINISEEARQAFYKQLDNFLQFEKSMLELGLEGSQDIDVTKGTLAEILSRY